MRRTTSHRAREPDGGQHTPEHAPCRQDSDRRPERQREAGVDDLQRIGAEEGVAGKRGDISRPRPVIPDLERRNRSTAISVARPTDDPPSTTIA